MWISEHGPHGPVSPISQKFSASKRSTCARSTSVTSLHSAAASSSVVCTVAQSAAFGSFQTPVRSSHAQRIASRL